MLERKLRVVLVALVLVGFVFGGFGVTAVAQNTLQKIVERGEIVAVLDATIPPLAYIDPKTGDVVGFCPDLIKLYADKLGVKVKIINSQWAGVVPSLLTGKVDVREAAT